MRTSRHSLWWVMLWASLISSVYLPSLWTRFDFIDDGNLVYPAVSRPEVQLSTHSPSFLITGAAAPRPGLEWYLLKRFTASYWGGWRTHSCNVWGKSPSQNLPDNRQRSTDNR